MSGFRPQIEPEAPARPGEPADAWRFLLSPPPPAPHHLPQALTSFIGRDADITQLFDPACRQRRSMNPEEALLAAASIC